MFSQGPREKLLSRSAAEALRRWKQKKRDWIPEKRSGEWRHCEVQVGGQTASSECSAEDTGAAELHRSGGAAAFTAPTGPCSSSPTFVFRFFS